MYSSEHHTVPVNRYNDYVSIKIKLKKEQHDRSEESQAHCTAALHLNCKGEEGVREHVISGILSSLVGGTAKYSIFEIVVGT